MIRRWRQARRQDLRQRLVQDVARTQGLMVATIADARRVGAEVPVGVTASTVIWRTWADQLQDWARVEGE